MKLTKEYLENLVENKQFVVFEGTTVTVCLVTLKNGFNLVGKSACLDPNNFDKSDGEQYAYEDAMDKLWELEGYLAKSVGGAA